jgi:hypothetical protein
MGAGGGERRLVDRLVVPARVHGRLAGEHHERGKEQSEFAACAESISVE